MPSVTVIDHPLVRHKLSLMRKKETATPYFRDLATEVSMLLAYEVTRDLQLFHEEIETPVAKMNAPFVDCKQLLLVTILRAGNGLLDGFLRMLPTAEVGHVGLYRDAATLDAVEYYIKLPKDLTDRDVIVVDPMLATGNSAAAALDRIKQRTPRSIKFVSLLAAPEGIQRLQTAHPDVHLYTAAIDDHLNDHGYIVPGLGDAGDRLFGTR